MNYEKFERWIKSLDWPYKAVLIDTEYGRAIAIVVGETISESWQSGDVMTIWPDGEYNATDGLENIQIVEKDLFTLKK